MDRRDRHGRTSRGDGDLRHRPADGFRTRDPRRFRQMAQMAVAALPGDLRVHVRGARLHIADIPPPEDLQVADVLGEVPLCRVSLPADGIAEVVVYRRPIELRATSREDLQAQLERAVRHAVLTAIGREPDSL